MKNFGCSNLAFAGVLLLALGSTPGTLSGQSQTQDKAPAGSPALPAPSAVDTCLDSKTLMEQLNKATRTTEEELQAQLANLQAKIRREVEMSAPEIGKQQSNSAELAGREWLARAQEFASHAELSALAQEKAEAWGRARR
jgi:hypothetical protein